MVEKMKFEKKENLKFWVRSGISVSILIIFYILFVGCIGGYRGTGMYIFMRLMYHILCVCVCFYVGVDLIESFREKKDKNIEEFNYNAKVDDFLEFLGNRELELKLILELDAPSTFEKTIVKNKLKYYVRKEGPEFLYFSVRRKGKEVWHWTTENNDEFLFQYFEPIYEVKKEK